jgi:pimeloyl-ACP methyl ester carboxylesterase
LVLRAFGDGKIFGETYGSGPVAVVWLHGWARAAGDFAASAGEVAAAGFSSVALDLPGFGVSPPPERAGGAHLYGDVVAAVLASIGPDPVVLVGHSFGGRVATVVAAEHPGAVRSLVLTGTPLLAREGRSRSPWQYRMVRALRARGLVGEERMEAARQRYGSRDYRAARGVVRDVLVAMVNESYEQEMAGVRAPVRLLWGKRDAEVPVGVAERSRDLFGAGASLVVLEGVGHFVPTEAPHELAATVLEALA